MAKNLECWRVTDHWSEIATDNLSTATGAAAAVAAAATAAAAAAAAAAVAAAATAAVEADDRFLFSVIEWFEEIVGSNEIIVDQRARQ